MDQITVKTIEILSRIIKKTPLNHKLLSRPPFRYLHDLITEVLTLSNFADGLYTREEMNADNIKNKDAKMMFLQKVIECVEITTEVKVKAIPSKIVAGLEAEETNRFLQILGKAVLKKVDSSKAVKKVLTGDSQSNSVEKSKSNESIDDSAENDMSILISAAAAKNENDTAKMESEIIQTKLPERKKLEVAGEDTHHDYEPNAHPQQHEPSSQVPDQLKLTIQSEDCVKEEEQLHLLRTRNIRPTTARAPPPKKQTDDLIEPKHVVIAKMKIEDDEDFLVISDDAGSNEDLNANHGSLVKKMLDAKNINKKDDDLIGRRKSLLSLNEKAGQTREIENSKRVVQIICQNVGPMGKSMDYLQEDIDAMNSELEFWKAQRIQYQDMIQEQEKKNEQYLSPLESQLKQLEIRICDQIQTNRKLKSSMFHNDEAIGKLLKNIGNPVR